MRSLGVTRIGATATEAVLEEVQKRGIGQEKVAVDVGRRIDKVGIEKARDHEDLVKDSEDNQNTSSGKEASSNICGIHSGQVFQGTPSRATQVNLLQRTEHLDKLSE